MLSKRDIDGIRRLGQARERALQGLFVAEGMRLVHDMLGAMRCTLLVVSSESYELLRTRLDSLELSLRPRRVAIVEPKLFERISYQRTPQSTLALFETPCHDLSAVYRADELVLLLDRVQDPGNMGTIIRTADWFGVRHLILSEGCADPFAPKVVQSTMGALARVAIHRLQGPTTAFLERYTGAILGAFLEGADLYTATLEHPPHEAMMLVVGNEGSGISPEVASLIHQRLTIPSFASPMAYGSESLNVAVATAICLSELRRRQHY